MSAKGKLLVLGIGNLIMGDEGVGVHVIQRLEQMNLPQDVCCLDGGTGSFYLLEDMQDADKVLIIDAAAFADSPGSIRSLEPRYSKDYPQTLTAHDIGLKDLLDAFYLLDSTPRVKLIAITIDPHQSLGMELSPEVEQAVGETVEMVLQEVDFFRGVKTAG